MAQEHGLEEHKGTTIPAEVRSLADRIRKKQPDVSDEYAYRTAWDIYRSHTAEGKKYPNKSEESGLAREGGGTGPIKKTAFWTGFMKKEAEELVGGKADGMNASQFDSKTLAKGIKTEMDEHTKDPNKAEEIAEDHIEETGKKNEEGKLDSKYYDELPKMEDKVKEKTASLYDLFMKTI